jgi:hypothetical protein
MSAAVAMPSAGITAAPQRNRFGRRFAEAALGLLFSVLQFSVAATVVTNALAAVSSGPQPPTISDVVGGALLILVPTLVFSLFFAVVLGLPASLALARLDRTRIGVAGRIALHYAAGWLIGGVVLAIVGVALQLDISESVPGGPTVSAVLPNLLVVAVLANAFGFAAAFGALMSRLILTAKEARS